LTRRPGAGEGQAELLPRQGLAEPRLDRLARRRRACSLFWGSILYSRMALAAASRP